MDKDCYIRKTLRKAELFIGIHIGHGNYPTANNIRALINIINDLERQIRDCKYGNIPRASF